MGKAHKGQQVTGMDWFSCYSLNGLKPWFCTPEKGDRYLLAAPMVGVVCGGKRLVRPTRDGGSSPSTDRKIRLLNKE